MPILCQEYMLFFCLPLSIQPRLNTQQQGRAPQCALPPCAPLLLCVEPWLNTQRQTEKYHILLAEDGHIFLICLQLVGTWVKNIFRNLVLYFLTCPQLVGTWVKKYFQEFGPIFFDMSSASGYMGAKYFQEFGPRFFDMSLESPGMGALP